MNGYNVCPTCGCPQHQGQGQWQGGQMWGGPAWGGGPQFQGGFQGCPGMGPQFQGGYQGGPGMGQGYYGAGWGAGPGYGGGYGGGYAPTYYGGLPTDSEIEEMIYDSIDADPLIPFDANIDISVEAGTVYLRGEVNSKRVKHAAGDDAWWIPGVIDVHNEIKVAQRRRSKQEGGEEEMEGE